MKTSAIALAIAGAAAVSAQTYPDGFPDCGKTCVGNLYGQAGTLNCGAADVACLCKNPNFFYGIRDCSNEYCGNADSAQAAINYGIQLCAGVGVAVPTGPADGGDGGSGGSAPTGNPVATSAVVITITTDGKTFETTSLTTVISGGGAAIPTPISTSTFTTVITSGSAVSTVVSESVISGIGGSAVVTAPSVTTVASGTATQDSTAASSTGGTSAGTDSPSASSSEAAGTSTSSGLGVQKTAAPIAGLFAAAGLAAVLL